MSGGMKITFQRPAGDPEPPAWLCERAPPVPVPEPVPCPFCGSKDIEMFMLDSEGLMVFDENLEDMAISDDPRRTGPLTPAERSAIYSTASTFGESFEVRCRSCGACVTAPSWHETLHIWSRRA